MPQEPVPGLTKRSTLGPQVSPGSARAASRPSPGVAPVVEGGTVARALKALVSLTEDRRKAREVRRDGAIQKLANSEQTAAALEAIERVLPGGVDTAVQGAALAALFRRAGLSSPLDQELARRKIGEAGAARAIGGLERRVATDEFRGVDADDRFAAALEDARGSLPGSLAASATASGAFADAFNTAAARLETQFASKRALEERQAAEDAIKGEIRAGSSDGTLRGIMHLQGATAQSRGEILSEIAQQATIAQDELGLTSQEVVSYLYGELERSVEDVAREDPGSAAAMYDAFDRLVLENGFPLDGSKGLPASAQDVRARVEERIAREQEREDGEFLENAPKAAAELTRRVTGAVEGLVSERRAAGSRAGNDEIREAVSSVIAESGDLLQYIHPSTVRGIVADGTDLAAARFSAAAEDAKKSRGQALLRELFRASALGDEATARQLRDELPPELWAQADAAVGNAAANASVRSDPAVVRTVEKVSDVGGDVVPSLSGDGFALARDAEAALDAALSQAYPADSPEESERLRRAAALAAVQPYEQRARELRRESDAKRAEGQTKARDVRTLARTDPGAAQERLDELQGVLGPDEISELGRLVDSYAAARNETASNVSRFAQGYLEEAIRTSLLAEGKTPEEVERIVRNRRFAAEDAARAAMDDLTSDDITVAERDGRVNEIARGVAEQVFKETPGLEGADFVTTADVERQNEERQLEQALAGNDPFTLSRISADRLRASVGIGRGAPMSAPLEAALGQYTSRIEDPGAPLPDLREMALAWTASPASESAASFGAWLSSGGVDSVRPDGTVVVEFGVDATDPVELRTLAASPSLPQVARDAVREMIRSLESTGRLPSKIGGGVSVYRTGVTAFAGASVRVSVPVPDKARLGPAVGTSSTPDELLAPKGAVDLYRGLLGLPDGAPRADVLEALTRAANLGDKYLY